MKFISNDQRFCIELSKASLDEMLRYIKNVRDKETGGIIIGKYSKNLKTANINFISGPPEDSLSGSKWFKRGVKGLSRLIEFFWKKESYYLGEWHFHPNGSPTPSGQDISQMRKIANSRQYNCPEPIMIIIGGSYINYQVQIFIVSAKEGLVYLKQVK